MFTVSHSTSLPYRPRHRSRRRAPSEEVSDAEMSYGEVPPRQDAESLIRGAANRAAPGSAGEEDEEMYDDDRSSDASDYSYDDDDDSGESGWYYEDREEEEEQEGAGGDRACGSAEEEAASAGVGGGPKAEGSAQAAATCCICMDPWAPYGAHRICCISCGHVYGRSCLERWLLRCGNVSAKCPQCSERFKHRHIINLYSPVHLWNDCCLKEARMEEERRLRDEAVRRQEERIAAQNRFFEERTAAQNQLFEERMAEQSQFFKEQRAAQRQDFEESRAAQRQDFEESRAAQYKYFEERLAAQTLAFKEMLAAQSQAIKERISRGIEERLEAERALYQEQFQSPDALNGKSPLLMPSLPPPPAPHTHTHLLAGSNDPGGGTCAHDQGSLSTHHGGATPTSRN
ncbi:uncharacterized protein LOC123450062 isoform X2 [Hordeum vulgare subsp. vulgare]|uniref:uncharacterized protein LOC123450062 isoform X2 n=1 Tax=Hordeum vulgare subsp. vulgare TaxID=112509 RepID=UPI000296402F|nr:uncharacterized protein LOC123450062 isoform X2 [Hordeum vulgare subsp. vulgare]